MVIVGSFRANKRLFVLVNLEESDKKEKILTPFAKLKLERTNERRFSIIFPYFFHQLRLRKQIMGIKFLYELLDSEPHVFRLRDELSLEFDITDGRYL